MRARTTKSVDVSPFYTPEMRATKTRSPQWLTHGISSRAAPPLKVKAPSTSGRAASRYLNAVSVYSITPLYLSPAFHLGGGKMSRRFSPGEASAVIKVTPTSNGDPPQLSKSSW